MTEKESAHPTSQQLEQLTSVSTNGDLITPISPTSQDAPFHLQDNSYPQNVLNSDDTSQENLDKKLGDASDDKAVKNDAASKTVKTSYGVSLSCPESEGESSDLLPLDSDDGNIKLKNRPRKTLLRRSRTLPEHSGKLSPSQNSDSSSSPGVKQPSISKSRSDSVSSSSLQTGKNWVPNSTWVSGWKAKLPLQTIMRLLQVLVPQVEKICIDKGLTDESEILRFLQHGTLVGLLPVPHPILIRKYQANSGTATWFRTYMWGIIYLRNIDPPVWYDTDVKLFEIQRV